MLMTYETRKLYLEPYCSLSIKKEILRRYCQWAELIVSDNIFSKEKLLPRDTQI